MTKTAWSLRANDVLSGQAWDSRTHHPVLGGRRGERRRRTQRRIARVRALPRHGGRNDGRRARPRHARAYEQWSESFWNEYERLRDDVDAGKATFLDPYAATEPAEFFAVVTEAFFMQPRELEAEHAGLYAQLRTYYRLDPARWLADEARG